MRTPALSRPVLGHAEGRHPGRGTVPRLRTLHWAPLLLTANSACAVHLSLFLTHLLEEVLTVAVRGLTGCRAWTVGSAPCQGWRRSDTYIRLGDAGRRSRAADFWRGVRWGGPVANPRFFSGFVTTAEPVTVGLLAVAEVARTRVFPAIDVRSLDPAVTGSRDRLRFESFRMGPTCGRRIAPLRQAHWKPDLVGVLAVRDDPSAYDRTPTAADPCAPHQTGRALTTRADAVQFRRRSSTPGEGLPGSALARSPPAARGERAAGISADRPALSSPGGRARAAPGQVVTVMWTVQGSCGDGHGIAWCRQVASLIVEMSSWPSATAV